MGNFCQRRVYLTEIPMSGAFSSVGSPNILLLTENVQSRSWTIIITPIDHRSVGLKVPFHLVYRVRRGGIQHEQRVQQSGGGGLDAAAAAAPDQVVDALPAGGQQRQRLLLLLPAAATRDLLPVGNPLLPQSSLYPLAGNA